MRLRNSHIHKIVNSNGAKPGMSESRLSCKVVTSVSVNERPASYCSKAVLTPSIPDGKLPQSIQSPSVNLTEATVGVKVMSTHLLTSAPIINIPSMDAPFVISCKIPPDKSSVILEPALYPPSCVYHINDILNKFQNMK